MSKVTNSQPSFLWKFFEKPSAEQQQQKKQKDFEEDEQKDQNDKDYEEEKSKEKSKTEEDPVLGLSVVEKATLFMKLEPEQRFSKWRKGTPTELPSGFQSPVDKVIDQPSVNKSSFPSHDRYPSTAPTPINLFPFFCPTQPLQVRGYQVRPFFVSGTSGHETNSEDGVVSSEGQEVAEIISKSYENSPVFHKKFCRSQKKVQRKVLTKKVWRRCSQHATNLSDVLYNARCEFEDFDKDKQHLPPPSTSNLLLILTALTSSNDELDDGNNVPEADDESFRACFQHPHFAPLCPPPPQVSKEKTLPADYDACNTNNDFSYVKRVAHLLVMKKDVPLVLRKSSRKSKNPLKSLTSWFDLTNQNYTEVHSS